MKLLVLFPMVLLPIWLFGSNDLSVHFFEGNIEALQEQAKDNGKMTIVYFYAQWCMPCNWMEENTYTDPMLINYVKQNYFPIKVNIDAPLGKMAQQKFEIKAIPTILIFDHQKRLVKKIENSLNAHELLINLKKYFIPGKVLKNNLSNEKIPVDILAPPQPLNLYYPPLLPESFTDNIKSEQDDFIIPTRHVNVVEEAQSKYCIQLGAYASIQNAEKRQKALQAKIDNKIYIKTHFINGKQIFRLLSGRFIDKNTASQHRNHLLKLGIHGFVKNIDI